MNHENSNEKHAYYIAQNEFVNSTIPAPFYVKGTGIDKVKKGYIHSRKGILNQFSGFSWILSGTMEMYNGPKRILAGPNHVYFNLFGEDTWNKVISDECEYRWITFSGPLADAILLSYHYSRVQISRYPYPKELFRKLDNLMNNDSPLQTRLKTALILELLAYADGTGYGSCENQRIIDNALALITRHLSESELGISFLCEHLHTSPTTLTRIFRKELGVSPGRRILDQRLQQGMGLLSGTDLPIAAIAEKCGFRDPKTFSRFIRRAIGSSARDFRKSQRGV